VKGSRRDEHRRHGVRSKRRKLPKRLVTLAALAGNSINQPTFISPL